MASASPPLSVRAYRNRAFVFLLVVTAASVALVATLLPIAGPFPWWLLVLVLIGFIAWQLSASHEAALDAGLLPVAALLCTLGLLVIARLDLNLARHQAVWMIVGLLIVVAGQRFFAQYRRLRHVKYFWVIASLLLFVLLRLFGQEINGARLWFSIFSLHIQPVEIIKLFMVFFMAAYLAENGPAIAAAPLSAIGKNLALVGPLLLGWGVSIVSLVVQRDVGMAALFLGILLVMLFAASRRLDLIVIVVAISVAGAWLVVHHVPYVQARLAVWLDPWSDPLGRGYQAEQAYFSLAAGGLFGTGYHLGQPNFIPDAATDYVFAAWAEEFGLIGGMALLGLYFALVVRGMHTAFAATDRFTSLLATGFAATLAIQVIVIVGGVVGLLPLTGITLPFFSYGGSSMVANLVMINFLWQFSRRPQEGSALEQATPADSRKAAS